MGSVAGLGEGIVGLHALKMPAFYASTTTTKTL